MISTWKSNSYGHPDFHRPPFIAIGTHMNYEEFIVKSDYAREAFTQAESALERGDRPVGAVILHQGKIIARGSDTTATSQNGLNHAIINAIAKIPEFLTNYGPDCTVYTTYEPCLMCLGAIKNFKIKNLYCMTGLVNPRKYDIEKLIPNYQKGLSEKWSHDLFEKYNNEFTTNGIPFPPVHLRFMVTAQTKLAGFKRGAEVLKYFEKLLERHRKPIQELSAVLDFGCGCGRVTRYWKKYNQVKVFGSDFNPELINWCKNNLRFADFKVNALQPPLEYEDEKFDFIYMISIFTHWSKELQLKWIREIRRILKPGGVLYFSTHGDAYLNQLNPEELAIYRKNDVVVKNVFVEGSNDCASFQSYQNVMQMLSPGLEVLEYNPSAQGIQDEYLFQKKRD